MIVGTADDGVTPPARDHVLARETVAAMAGIVADLSGAGGVEAVTAAQFRDRVANGRKTTIRILEFCDWNGLTLRRLNPRRADLFDPVGAAPPTGEESL